MANRNRQKKNPFNKVRDKDDPYEIWVSEDGMWEWRVLRKYQNPEYEEQNYNAVWYCAVKSPFTNNRYEVDDVYVRNIKKDSKRNK